MSHTRTLWYSTHNNYVARFAETWHTFFALSFILALYWKFQHAPLYPVFANWVTYYACVYVMFVWLCVYVCTLYSMFTKLNTQICEILIHNSLLLLLLTIYQEVWHHNTGSVTSQHTGSVTSQTHHHDSLPYLWQDLSRQPKGGEQWLHLVT